MWKYSKFICPLQYLLRHHTVPGAPREFRSYVSSIPCHILLRNYMVCVEAGRRYERRAHEKCMYYPYNDKCWQLYTEWRVVRRVEV